MGACGIHGECVLKVPAITARNPPRYPRL
jgi:hypothetical protein